MVPECLHSEFYLAKDDGSGGDNWSYKMCKVPVKSSPPINKPPSFIQANALCVTNPQCQTTEGTSRLWVQCALPPDQWHQHWLIHSIARSQCESSRPETDLQRTWQIIICDGKHADTGRRQRWLLFTGRVVTDDVGRYAAPDTHLL